jgi:hypothetical protein
MTTAIIGVGNIGGTVARELASGGSPFSFRPPVPTKSRSWPPRLDLRQPRRRTIGMRSNGPIQSSLPCGLTQ